MKTAALMPMIYLQRVRAVRGQKATLREEFPVGGDIINQFSFPGGQTLPETLLLRYEKMNHFIVGGGGGLRGGCRSCVVGVLEAMSGVSAGGLGTPMAGADADMSHREQHSCMIY